jgi:5-formyltetrahydrofolate cyclo-ligase
VDKKALRQKLLAKRKELTGEKRGRYEAEILRHLTAMPEVQGAQTILLYLDFRGEVNSEPMIRWGIAEGKTVCAPVTIVKERRLIPVRIETAGEYRIGAYGIREPKMRPDLVVKVQEIDAVVLTGVGFDRRGGRLGYGGGYYDRFLPQLRADAKKIAVAYEVQVIEEVPMEEHDTWLDALVTEKGVWRR